jgi:hypothetical protein
MYQSECKLDIRGKGKIEKGKKRTKPIDGEEDDDCSELKASLVSVECSIT